MMTALGQKLQPKLRYISVIYVPDTQGVFAVCVAVLLHTEKKFVFGITDWTLFVRSSIPVEILKTVHQNFFLKWLAN